MRETLSSLFRSVGLRVELFGAARDFAQIKMPDAASCLVLDIRLPGVSGLDFQAELAKNKIRIPIVFITGHGDIPMSVQAMKSGAIEFLTKPFRPQELVEAIHMGIARDRARLENEHSLWALRQCFESLTTREREIMIHVARGRLSKQIAGDIGISEATVKVHRGNLMKKMKAGSLAELGQMADKLKLMKEQMRYRDLSHQYLP